MGNADSSTAAAAAAGDAIQSRVKKEKRRAKRFGCFCCWCNIAAIVSFIIGIVLLVYFASSLGDSYAPVANASQNTAKGVTYTGIAFICLGVLLLIIGVLFALGLWIAYRKISGKSKTKNFVPQKYAPGTAPYPQQDWGIVPDPHQPAATPVPPSYPGQAGLDTDNITPEIR